MINWPKTQKNIGAMVDGIPGRETYGKLLRIVAPTASEATIERLAQSLAKHAASYGQANSPARLADFIAQIANETGGFKRFEENLNYSAEGLARTWPSRYSQNGKRDGKPNKRAKDLEHRPEAIANDTYALRMGNESTANDDDANPDGWQYRGRGALQLTGKDNYDRYGRLLGLNLVAFPEMAADPAMSLLIALEFYKQGAVNQALDRGDTVKAREITNGAQIGLPHVNKLREKLLKVIVA